VQPVFKVNNDRRSDAINQERAKCRTASGSERMLRSTMKRAFGRIPRRVLESAHYRSRFCISCTSKLNPLSVDAKLFAMP
jgi:hypothetical protein